MAPRGYPLRQIRATVPGFSVLGGSLALAEILHQHALDSVLKPIVGRFQVNGADSNEKILLVWLTGHGFVPF